MSAIPSSVVSACQLLVRYGGNPKPTLEEISFSVPRGSVYALLGRNGAGKSSLVRCLLGQQKPTAGGCFLFGEDVWKRRARLMAKVGVVPEDPDAPPSMTARHLSAFCARIYPTWDAPAVEARLARFGVPAGTPYCNLSKGQRAPVALALAPPASPPPRVPPRAPRPRRPDTRPRRRRATRVLRGARRRAGRPRNDRTPHVTRPHRRREHGDACRDAQGRAADPRRGPRGAEVALPAPALRERGDGGSHEVRPGAFGLRRREGEGAGLGRRGRRLELRRRVLCEIRRPRGRRGRRGLGPVARGHFRRHRGRSVSRSKGECMRGTVAVAAREVSERKLVLFGALLMGVIPLAIPLLPGLGGPQARDVRFITALFLSLTIFVAFPIVFGATVLVSEITQKRIAFYFSRPLSAASIWAGKMLAVFVISVSGAC